MRLFYFVTDPYPAYRVDLTELFSNELHELGLEVDWSMRRNDSGIWRSIKKNTETIYLPLALGGIPFITPIVRRLGEMIGEIGLTIRLLFGQRYDFIQVRDDRYTAAFFAWLVARIRGSKFIYWVSFSFPENDLEKADLSSGPRRIFLMIRGVLTKWWLYKAVLPRADHVFVQSERMRQDIASYGLAISRMTSVPMGIPRRLLEWSKTSHYAIESGTVNYIGSFASSRHLDTIIDSFALVLQQLPDIKFYMVGSGDTQEEQQYLENLCKQLGISDSVIFTGFVPMEQAWSLVAKAAICISPIYPSPKFLRASSTKLNEYMALGRPVIANEHPEQSETLASSGAGLCVPWSAEDFANAMIYLLSHPYDAEQMGKKGPVWVAENRRYDLIAAQVFHQYRSLLEGGN
ncbi:MAG: glycosyltransferase family 4 protein [Methylobacter sp.]